MKYMSEMDLAFFKNKVNSGNFDDTQLHDMLTKAMKEGDNIKATIITEYIKAGKKEGLKKLKESQKELSFEEYVAKKYLQVMDSASKRNIEFKLKLIDVRNLLRTKTCYYSGVTFNGDEQAPTHLTFDRKESSKGYTKENTVACAHFVNVFKNDVLEKSDSVMKGKPDMLFKVAGKILSSSPKKEKTKAKAKRPKITKAQLVKSAASQ